jgi:glycosyltransferase involved in cell wall biosynthesis
VKGYMMQRLLPLVTIVIPTYNRAGSYLRQTLESALHQTYSNIEILISDNCSVDNTTEYIRSITDSRLKYFRHEQNIGPNKNCDFCIAQAKGDYILVLHDDDVIDEDFVDACMRAIDYQAGVGIIRTGTRVIDSNGTVIGEAPNLVGGLPTEAFFRSWFAGKTTIYLCSTLFHTDKLRAIGGLRSKHYLHDDAMAIVQLATAFGRADVKEVKASFRRHNQRDNLSPTDIAHWCEDALLVLDLICKSVPENVALVRKEGEQFLSDRCYDRAAAVKSSLTRFRCYLVVFEKFHYRYFPPNALHLFKAPFLRLIRYINTRLSC